MVATCYWINNNMNSYQQFCLYVNLTCSASCVIAIVALSSNSDLVLDDWDFITACTSLCGLDFQLYNLSIYKINRRWIGSTNVDKFGTVNKWDKFLR